MKRPDLRAARRPGVCYEPLLPSHICFCVYCGGPDQHREHIVPASAGGRYWVPSCVKCNAYLADGRDDTLGDRYARVADTYRRKYVKILPYDYDKLLEGTTGRLRRHFTYERAKQAEVRAKIAWAEACAAALREVGIWELFDPTLSSLRQWVDLLRSLDA